MGTTSISRPLNGARKVAILMAVLGEEAASSVLRQLSDEHVQRVAEELTKLGDIPVETSTQILEEYYRLTTSQEFMAQGGPGYAERLLVKTFGEETAKSLSLKLSQARQTDAGRGPSLEKADPQQIAKLLEGEHPQTVALVLGCLQSKQASSVIMKLSDSVRSEAVRRLAGLQQFSPEMTETLSDLLSRRIQSLGQRKAQAYEGFKKVAEMMNSLEATAADEILQSIEDAEPQLAINIRNQMFTFEDFLQVPEQGLRELIGQVDRKMLTLALKSASEELKNHIFRTMSSRAVDMLKEDMDALGPVRAKEVAEVQQNIVKLARQLESEGKLVLRAEGEDEYVV